MHLFRSIKTISILTSIIIALCSSASYAASEDGPKTLKVCADPNYMPFSNKNKLGYENQIAELIGKELNIPVEYEWFPQRMGFIRNTLRKESGQGDGSHLCDLVIGVPNNYGMAMTTKPYLHSTYAIATLKDGKLKDLKKGNDLVQLPAAQLSDLKIAITERSPGAVWLAKHALYEQMAPYIAQSGDPGLFPGEPMLRDLLTGDVDAAIVWGPTAGYFAKTNSNIRVLTLASVPGVRFDFSISAAVRYGESGWKDKIEGIIQKNSVQINKILTTAGVPLLALDPNEMKGDDDDDDDDKKPIKAVESAAQDAPSKADASTAYSYESHVKCEGKDCKIDKFLLKGFRAFSQCQVCHGIDGNGSTIAPSLLTKLEEEITYDIFVDRVSNGFTGQLGVMPPWKANPNVMKNIDNLYAYLKARSDGVIPAGRLKKFK